MPDDAFERASMQADLRRVLQRPAHACSGKAERRRLRQAQHFLGQKARGELFSDAVIERIAAGEHHDGFAAARRDSVECLVQRAWPRKLFTPDQWPREFEMSRA